MHFEGWLYDLIILALLRDCISESTDPRPHFQALQYHFCAYLLFATLLFLFIQIIKIYFYHQHYTSITISSRGWDCIRSVGGIAITIVTEETCCPNVVKESRSERVGLYRNEQVGFACLALLKIV